MNGFKDLLDTLESKGKKYDIDKLKTIEKQIKNTNFELCHIVEII